MDYRVIVAEEWELPTGTDWVIARTAGAVSLIVRRSRASVETGLAEVLSSAWAASAKYGAGVPPRALLAS